MSNSAIPIISAAVLVAGLVIVSMRIPNEPAGVNGPDIQPGIFLLPTSKRLLLVSPTLDATTVATMSGVQSPDAREPERWRVVVISALDRQSLTRALALACAEKLTQAGCVVQIDLPGSTPLQFAADRVISIMTLDQNVPGTTAGACSAHLQVSDRLLAFPLDHPAADAQPRITAPLSTDLLIAYQGRGQPVGASGTAIPWGQWYAAVGRDMETHLLGCIVPQGIPRLLDADHRPRHDIPERADWKSLLPAPPQIAPAHWIGGIQEEFVRGWVGNITGQTTQGKDGTQVASILPFEKALNATRLIKEVAWREEPVSDPHERHWQRAQDDMTISAHQNASGWELVMWQERVGIATTFQDWLDAAAGGDAIARIQLSRYRDSLAVPQDLRTKALALLAGASAPKPR